VINAHGLEAVVFDINREARYLGLPSFKADITGKGFITGTGTVQNFSAHGQYVLDSGTSVTYGNTTVVLDSSEQLVAYRLGDGNWTLMRVLARPKITTDKGWYTVMRSTGVIEMMVVLTASQPIPTRTYTSSTTHKPTRFG